MHFTSDMVKINVSGKTYLTTNAIPTCCLDVSAENNCELSSFLSIDQSCSTESQPLDLSLTSRSSLNLNFSEFQIGISNIYNC